MSSPFFHQVHDRLVIISLSNPPAIHITGVFIARERNAVYYICGFAVIDIFHSVFFQLLPFCEAH